jgi:hypothetical protein
VVRAVGLFLREQVPDSDTKSIGETTDGPQRRRGFPTQEFADSPAPQTAEVGQPVDRELSLRHQLPDPGSEVTVERIHAAQVEPQRRDEN